MSRIRGNDGPDMAGKSPPLLALPPNSLNRRTGNLKWGCREFNRIPKNLRTAFQRESRWVERVDTRVASAGGHDLARSLLSGHSPVAHFETASFSTVGVIPEALPE